MKMWAAAVLSAALLELPFPLAGPMPPWRSIFAWFGLVPLLWALLSPATVIIRRPFRRAFLLSYLCGVLWYMGNCYWVRDTMIALRRHACGAPSLLLIAFSLVLGLYFGLFGLGVCWFVGRPENRTRPRRCAVYLGALDLAAARITSVPWDQLGYSQVDNGFINQLAPWTGVYGISFVLLLARSSQRIGFRFYRALQIWCVAVLASTFAFLAVIHTFTAPWKTPPPSATAILIQPNLDVGGGNEWAGPGQWERHIADFSRLAAEQCKTYIAGIPQTGAPSGEIICPPYPTHPDLVVWPEAPAPFTDSDPRFQKSMALIAQGDQAPLITGGIGVYNPSADRGDSRLSTTLPW